MIRWPSAVLSPAQQKRLGSSAIWHASVPEAVAASGGAAIIVSNELVDAFPCRVFKKGPAGWRELALRIEGGRIVEEWAARPLPDSTAFLHLWPDGQRVEVQSCTLRRYSCYRPQLHRRTTSGVDVVVDSL